MITDQKNSRKQGFYIEVGCPGCGGELEIDSDFFVTQCSHCGTPLRLELPDIPPAYFISFKLTKRKARFKIDRKLKAFNLPLTGHPFHFKKIYYPFWKIDAMLLRCRNHAEKIIVSIDDSSSEEIVDYKKSRKVNLSPYQNTVSASDNLEGIPDSIGIRGQSLKVVPFAATKIEEDSLAMDVKRAPVDVIKTVELSLAQLNAIDVADFGENITRIFNPISSLIYFPFGIVEDYAGAGFRRYVLDGLTGRILFSKDSENENIDFGQDDLSKNSSTFVSDGLFTNEIIETHSKEFESNVLESGVDKMSERAHTLSTEPYVHFGKVDVVFHRCRECGDDLPHRPSCIYICSNCLEVTCLDRQVKSNPKILVAECADNNAKFFPFWKYQLSAGNLIGSFKNLNSMMIPAFKIPNFEALYRLASRTSTASGNIDFVPTEQLDKRFKSVDLLPSEGIALANVVYYRKALEKSNKLPAEVPSIDLKNLRLCFIPFELQNYFYLDSILKSVSFEKNLG